MSERDLTDWCFVCGHVQEGHDDYHRRGDGSVDHLFCPPPRGETLIRAIKRAEAAEAERDQALARAAAAEGLLREIRRDFGDYPILIEKIDAVLAAAPPQPPKARPPSEYAKDPNGPRWFDYCDRCRWTMDMCSCDEGFKQRTAPPQPSALLCDAPGGCGPTCRQAIARGDDMVAYWPNGDLEAMPEEEIPLIPPKDTFTVTAHFPEVNPLEPLPYPWEGETESAPTVELGESEAKIMRYLLQQYLDEDMTVQILRAQLTPAEFAAFTSARAKLGAAEGA
jgi:hypothetical protein